ncbi:hypothetical protein ACNI65_12385 [Roseateles sp. So40a]|uniref:hypothetical protein n=1 Tax=Roseateles sp. So40a TaxID=3400226 RepID=UPI003A892E21
MTTQLILFRLSIRSSYAADTEEEATEDSFDTIQFFSHEGAVWRIKTFAIDQDVHVWSMDVSEVDDLVELAVGNTESNYGDVLEEGYILNSETGLEGLREQLAERDLDTHLNETSVGAVFWTPAGTSYKSKSRPGN